GAYAGAHSTIGNLINSAGGQSFNGQIDEIRLWNVAKSDAQVLAEYQMELTGNEAGLVAYYNFEDATGNTLSDLTSSNYDGTISNGSWTFNSDAGAPLCSVTSASNVTITVNPNPTASNTVSNENCDGAADG